MMPGMWWHSLNRADRQKTALCYAEGRMWWYHRKWVINPGWSGDGGGRMERHVRFKEDEPGESGKS